MLLNGTQRLLNLTLDWLCYNQYMNTDSTAKIAPACPSCGRKFRSIEPMRVATTVHLRTCRNPKCRETWNVTVRPLRVWADGGRIDRCELTFIRHGEVA